MPNFIALTSAGIELLLAEELVELGATDVAPKVQSVHFFCSFETAQKICLWTRLATRILRHVVQVSGSSKEKIYDGVLGFDWHPFFTKTKVFAVEFVGTDKSIRNSQFGGQIVKDAIVDNIREETGKRPDVDKQSPDLIIQARLFKGQCNVYVDFSGPSLHQRGYRKAQGAAPLKEHLAAGIIRRSGWDGKSSFVDLFCGSGTLLIEAAMINKNRAPGLTRRQFSFVKHPEFLVHKYEAIRDEAIAQEKPISADIIGFEIVGYVLDIARENIAMAGLEGDIKLAQQDAVKATVGKDVTPGWIVSNPPYGERIGDSITLLTLFKKLGFNLKSNYVNWNMSLLCTENTLLKLLKLQKDKEYKFKNGAIDILLVKYQLTEQQCEMGNVTSNGYFLSKDGQAFSGRIDKNLKRLSKWIKKENISCYRIYDADIPEYNVAVDYYDGRIVVYEYQAPKTVNANLAEQRLLDVLSILQEKFDLTSDKFSLKVRKSQKGKEQYQKEAERQQRFIVEENGAKLYVNIHDYLDTGLFLDHRSVRQRFASMCSGKSILNLFCYTGSVSVHAALNGAKRVTSVDMSNTYLEWAEDNFFINKLDKKNHFFHRADCLAWLTNTRDKFDLVFLDPPSFSNSKKMDRTWDVQRDHVEILKLMKDRLMDGGQILFSNNLRGFKLDVEGITELGYKIEDITKDTLPPDFERNAKIHHCWILSVA
ncbi:bifunctional 23S rRNA (guanine(2069)-N(7))-methyltransferase RlmK/23S rRNA (guanine(2445)-N(2))-methyltransferase RlmL [Psychrosphaera sp. B3R10]|nr:MULTISPECIES: bifunctional 23S rRNA (guanine(2069)-N(7))-methyltransferase RlmK/23S rRNA (guanine(2445)-N(2))-methyltransferase RlmL [unclassified Psychrosphaera]MBU2882412.1 bifunctional 23S rRNA (guanine(2069)-N(7))-methyltransferase RlmK/23S rRNA (guanine(2445)-N(2))-methyltransferase RlmL [Psychrosphaera sp. I2R16]MBU2989093.1 bifunctional 23S rRNA (guanine(2069)-N(7))-methyltransferase RlmK/23S rRNA (guanine(2445)-N(2))-methyltransferase RlmL [Psychrosphaera sp. B3R10]